MKRRIMMEVWELTCGRCGNRWLSLAEQLPTGCARCKNHWWDKPRVYNKKKRKLKPISKNRDVG